MTENKYDKKAEQKLLVAIYHKYVKDQGDQPSQLDFYKFNGLENDLYEDIQEILNEPLDKNKRPNIDGRYFMNLKDYGYISGAKNIDLLVFKLTKQGFYEAKRLINPYITFFINHWKYITPMALTFILILIAIIRLTICK